MLTAWQASRAVPLRWEVPRRACPEAQEDRACRGGCTAPLRWEVPRRACPEAQEGRAGCLSSWSCCAFELGGSLKGVSRGAGRSCWLPVELVVLCLCVRRFPEGRVPRRRKVVLAAC